MNPRRFDSLTRRLGVRRSRRDAMRAGAATALGMAALGSARTADTQDAVMLEADTTATDRFVALSFYSYDGAASEAVAALKPLIRVMQQQPGFLTLSFIEDDAAIYLVTVFLDNATSDAGTKVLDAWIAENLPELPGNELERDSGDVFLRSELGAGCRCQIDDDEACGSGDLYCCAPVDENRGICLTSATICPDPEDNQDDTGETDDASAPAPTATTAAASACTSEGCNCVSGVSGACDGGLFCCGANDLGGGGVCMVTCPCGNEGCDCIAAVVNTCDAGLTCCAPGEIGGHGTCKHACTCTSEGCACITGTDGVCDDGLSCCGIGSTAPGSIGVCLNACNPSSPCPGAENCECGAVWKCNDGLTCCGATDAEDSGICQTEC